MQLVNQSYLFSSSEFDMYTMCHSHAFKVYNTIGLNPNSCSYCSKKKINLFNPWKKWAENIKGME